MKTSILAVTLAALAAIAGANAQSYPSRPVTIIVPYPAGGPTDQVARQIAPKLSDKFGHNFIVENVSGGGTNIAGARVARAAPDGHTLFIHNLQISANVSLYKTLPFDTEKDFIPVAMINSNPLVLVGRKTLEANTLPELIAWMKTTPAKMGHPGTGSTGHLATFLLAQALGVKVDHIPYRGAAPMLQDTLGGHIDLFFATPQQVVGQFASGAVKVFGITVEGNLAAVSRRAELRAGVRLRARRIVLAHLPRARRHARADRRFAQCGGAGGAGRSGHPERLGAPAAWRPIRPSSARRKAPPPISRRRSRTGARSCATTRSRRRRLTIHFDAQGRPLWPPAAPRPQGRPYEVVGITPASSPSSRR